MPAPELRDSEAQSPMLLLLATARAATWTVDPAGTGDFLTIQEAVTAASDGDTVEISAGVFTEDISLGGRALTLAGAGSASTILRASSLGLDAIGAPPRSPSPASRFVAAIVASTPTATSPSTT